MSHGFCDVLFNLFNKQCNNVIRLMALLSTPSSKTSAAPSRVKDFPDRKGPTSRTIRTMTHEVPVFARTCRTETPMVTKHGIWTWKLSRMRIEKVSLKCKHVFSQFMTLQTWWIIRFHGFRKSFSEHEQQTPHGGIVKSENMSESELNCIGPLHYQWRNRKLNFLG